MSVGFVGAGRMGLPMVRRLTGAGESVRMLVRSHIGENAARATGAHPARTLVDVARDCDSVVICVHTDSQVLDICVARGLIDAMRPGAVLIVHTTGSPFTVETIEKYARTRNIDVVDAPVSGGPDDIATGSITVFVGGSEKAVNSARKTLAQYADPVRHVGPLGAGQSMKLVNNAIFLSNIEVIASAAQFGAELGIDERRLIECLREGSADSYALRGVSTAGGSLAFKQSVAEFLGKDIDVVRRVARGIGFDLGPIGALLGVPDAARD